MRKIFAEISMSLDGYVAGPNVDLNNGMGDEGERLHEWMFPAKGKDEEVAAQMFKNVGATIMGRKMFDVGEAPWGDIPPFHMPVFVLTHRSKESVTKEGGTTFIFVMDGLESALEQAKAAAGGQDVLVIGGANTIQQYIQRGVLDELRIHLVPILLGGGTRLFDGLVGAPIKLEPQRLVDSPVVTHLAYRFAE